MNVRHQSPTKQKEELKLVETTSWTVFFMACIVTKCGETGSWSIYIPTKSFILLPSETDLFFKFMLKLVLEKELSSLPTLQLNNSLLTVCCEWAPALNQTAKIELGVKNLLNLYHRSGTRSVSTPSFFKYTIHYREWGHWLAKTILS